MLTDFKTSTFSILLFLISFSAQLNAQDLIPTTLIGTQKWMVKNLNVSTFRNGDSIPEAKTDQEWKKAYEESKPAWCYFGNDPANELKYGKLYNWFAVNDVRGLAPIDYHILSKTDLDSLIYFLGGQAVAGKKMKSTEGWPKNSNGSNESGFTGLPGSIRFYNGYFSAGGNKIGHWWTVTELTPMYAWQFYLLYTDDGIGFYSHDFGKGAGMSVRCLMD